MTEKQGYGQLDLRSTASRYRAHEFMVEQIIARSHTTILVKVTKVTNEAGVEPVGFVDVQPLVAQVDGQGNTVSHGTIPNVPYCRIQGGRNAIILDPEVGDLGICVVAERDISNVKTNKDLSSPGSFRRFDLSDSVYLGGLLNDTPEQYIRFTSDQIEVVSPTKIKLVAPTVEIEASTQFHVTGPSLITGDLTVTGAIAAASAAIAGAITAASAAISGAVTAASLALTGALTALSAAITNLLSAGSITSSTTIVATGQVTGNGIGLSTHHHTTTVNIPSTPSGNLPFASGASQA